MTNSTTHLKEHPSFLTGGGETGDLVARYNWESNPLGPIDRWPASLRATVGIVLHSGFPTLLFWGDDLICFYNDAFVPSLGVDGKHPAIGKRGRDMWSDIWETIYPLMKSVMTTGQAVRFEDLLVPFYRNGKTEDSYWTFSYSPAYGDAGEVSGVFVTCHETTEKLMAHQVLEASRDELVFATESAELATWDYNPETNKFSANGRLKEWFGLRADEEIPLDHALAVIESGDRERVAAAIARALDPAVREKYDIDYTVVHPGNGKRREVRARGLAYFNEGGQAFRFAGILQDVTEQKSVYKKEQLARQLVEESERNFRSTILNAPLAICILKGPAFIVEIANDRMFELWGKTAGSMLHKPMFDGLPEARHQGFEELLHQVYVTGKGYSAQNIPVRLERGGLLRQEYVDFLFEAQFDAYDKVVGILAVAILVTPQVTAMRHIEEIVASRTADLAAANKSLKRSNDELSQFAHVTSHDLQEPIRKAGVFMSMLQEVVKDPSPLISGYISKINQSHERMLSLIRDILNYSELGNRPAVFQPVVLGAIVAEVVSDYELLIAQKGATISVGDLPVIEAVPLQMTQLFGNLISNALKFTRKNVRPFINIDAQPDDEWLYITVSDNGIGLDEKYGHQIFDIFQRLHRKTDYAGNGIGLALVRKIMENHRGAISVSSKPGEGATFHLCFPKS